MEDFVKFFPFQSFVDSSFWHILSKKKLDEFKLKEGPHNINGSFEHLCNPGTSNKLIVDMDSFDKLKKSKRNTVQNMKGAIYTLNTIENFQKLDKMEFLNKFGLKNIGNRINNLSYLQKPNSICRFFIMSHSNLKTFKFYFWFAFPAPIFPANPILRGQFKFLNEICSDKQMDNFFQYFDYLQSEKKSMFFTVFLRDNLIRVDKFSFFDINNESCILGFCDPSSDPHYPGWPLRILLFAISNTLIEPNEKKTVKILCYRNSFTNMQRDISSSSIMEVELTGFRQKAEDIKFIGWEKWKDELKPKIVNLSSSMNPNKLAENAVDLNLKLMKWRLMPELDLNSITRTKCLLLGAGTLGCNVARQLLAWNVNMITLVDNGTVSYSNPVRQSLFTFDQSCKRGNNKAEAAAESLRKIYPGVKVSNHNITIPMPGHFVSESEKASVEEAVKSLESLIQSHDVVYLLLDTREARWLPTMLGCIYGKMVINAALGFDTYLVMRHGVTNTSISNTTQQGDSGIVQANQLGCYFCTDVVGPANSTRDRTLDQQCTVTRPGVSMIAAGIAVELMVTLLQMTDGVNTPVHVSDNFDENETCMGSPFHQLRGFITNYSCITAYHTASQYCTACSQKVIQSYQSGGFEFLMKVFNEHNFLEDITGLTKLHDSIDFDCVTALSDSSLEN